MATSADIDLATREDFLMATDICPYVKALQYFAQYCGFPQAKLEEFVKLAQQTWPV